MANLIITQEQKRTAYRVICGEIRKRIRLSKSEAYPYQWRKCQLWKELLPDIYEKAERSVYQSPIFD